MSDLLKLFDKYNTDKGTRKHFYNEVYEPHFEAVREEPINLLEVGCFKGESTAALYEYFPNANIYTIDIFVRAHPGDLPILNEERVHWLKADSMKKDIQEQIKKAWGDIQFDFIIDDGAHWPEANRLTFKYLLPFLKDDGKYFVEDVWPFDIMDFNDMQHPWILKDPDKYNKAEYARYLAEIEKNMCSYFLYDVRQKKNMWVPDSTIMMIEK